MDGSRILAYSLIVTLMMALMTTSLSPNNFGVSAQSATPSSTGKTTSTFMEPINATLPYNETLGNFSVTFPFNATVTDNFIEQTQEWVISVGTGSIVGQIGVPEDRTPISEIIELKDPIHLLSHGSNITISGIKALIDTTKITHNGTVSVGEIDPRGDIKEIFHGDKTRFTLRLSGDSFKNGGRFQVDIPILLSATIVIDNPEYPLSQPVALRAETKFIHRVTVPPPDNPYIITFTKPIGDQVIKLNRSTDDSVHSSNEVPLELTARIMNNLTSESFANVTLKYPIVASATDNIDEGNRTNAQVWNLQLRTGSFAVSYTDSSLNKAGNWTLGKFEESVGDLTFVTNSLIYVNKSKIETDPPEATFEIIGLSDLALLEDGNNPFKIRTSSNTNDPIKVRIPLVVNITGSINENSDKIYREIWIESEFAIPQTPECPNCLIYIGGAAAAVAGGGVVAVIKRQRGKEKSRIERYTDQRVVKKEDIKTERIAKRNKAETVAKSLALKLSTPCSICTEGLTSIDNVVLKCPECKEMFHSSCLKMYLDDNNVCPSCDNPLGLD